MENIIIKDYLTEDKLRKTLQKIIGIENWIGNEIRVPGTMKRWDMGFKYNSINYIIEFDGDKHYMDSLLIKSDNIKDEIARKLKYITIRIPYFIQLTNETFRYYFPFIVNRYNIFQNYPHGFIDKKATFPASYCKLGIIKFNEQIDNLPKTVSDEIFESLKIKAKEYGDIYVY